MKQQFAAILTGSDSPVDGIVKKIDFDGFPDAYKFESIDNSLHLIIAKDDDDKWIRLAGTEPYLGSWIEELARQIV
jgi:Na+-translocating ferredoxin:NAD+ oxidoreductase RnfC subunit